MRRLTHPLAVLVLGLFVCSVALASVTFTPPDKNKVMMSSVRLMPMKAAPKSAGGTASVMTDPGQRKYGLTLEIKGLDPKKVYTAWLDQPVDAKSKVKAQGLGTPPFTLKVDPKGDVNQVYALKANPKAAWKRVMIVEHPDKNPKSTKGLTTVLTGDLTKLG